MFIVCYLAQEDRHIAALRGRLAMARLPKALLLAHSVPELVNQAQTLPINAVVVDITWPRAVWEQIESSVRSSQPALPIFALSAEATDYEWWRVADDLLCLDENPELFLYRIERLEESRKSTIAPTADAESSAPSYPAPNAIMAYAMHPQAHSLLENSQFRQFADIFSNQSESTMVESFVAWIQQACQTSRVVMLLRDVETGDFTCAAQRGLPSTLVPHCRFPQTSTLCRWLATTGHILLKDTAGGIYLPHEVLAGLELMQAAVAIPTMLDGQLVGILGVGPRLVGQGYSATELEGLFALGGQIAMALHNFRMHRVIRLQQEMTEHMLHVMPTGTVVLGEDHRIALVNPAAAKLMGTTPASLQGRDLRALPSPLGDMAYEALVRRCDVPRREMMLSTNGYPVAVTCSALDTTPPSSLVLIEDLSAHKKLEEEQERRIDLEVVTNLVHYLAHELRNPLVALSTFNNMAPTHAGEDDFREFCESVLQVEIGRVNLLLEQLLVLTNHAEFLFDLVDLTPILARITDTPEMRSSVVSALPAILPTIHGDARRLETAFTCILRTVTRLAAQQSPVAMQVMIEDDTTMVIQTEATVIPGVTPDWLLNPWQQLIGGGEQQVDFGLSTAQFIIEQHGGSLSVSVTDNVLVCLCRLPVGAGGEVSGESRRDAERTGARR